MIRTSNFSPAFRFSIELHTFPSCHSHCSPNCKHSNANVSVQNIELKSLSITKYWQGLLLTNWIIGCRCAVYPAIQSCYIIDLRHRISVWDNIKSVGIQTLLAQFVGVISISATPSVSMASQSRMLNGIWYGLIVVWALSLPTSIKVTYLRQRTKHRRSSNPTVKAEKGHFTAVSVACRLLKQFRPCPR